MKFKAILALSMFALTSQAQTPGTFVPYQATNLRLPSVPLVVNDPYFSIWSPFDHLNDGATRHWTNDEKPVDGLLRVDGHTYSFMGTTEKTRLVAIAPMADQEAWEGKYTRRVPGQGWQNPSFDASAWRTGRAAWGSDGLSNVNTHWSEQGSDLYVRRDVRLTGDDLNSDLYMVYSHDDVFELFINGTKVADTGETWVDGVKLHLTGDMKKLLHEGDNVIAAHCHNTTGGAYTDFGLYRNNATSIGAVRQARQMSVSVLATSTYYTFRCGDVYLDLVFTAPMVMKDYYLISTPVNYISYQVRPADGKKHNVQLLFTASPLLASNKPSQPMESSVGTRDGVKYLKTGTIDQPILAKKGDGICIDWGYLYVPEVNGKVSLCDEVKVRSQFVNNGTLAPGQTCVRSYSADKMPTLAYYHDFGAVTTASSFAMIGYDEVQDIEYMYKRYKGYWAHNGSVTIFDAFNKLRQNYTSIMDRCRRQDKIIYDDGMKSGGKKYAEILSGSYRHVIAAHKLFRDDEGNMLFFSKENNSNGCVNTVDLTYPSAPLFLVYDPELEKGMITSILNYSASGRWTKPFAAHDIGTYPIANGQVYGGDMPLEESGNILTLVAQISKQEGNTSYANPYWNLLKTWADYLSENGQDPSNQLCTDDFAGHWAHNANLSVKAIMGIAGFAEMAKIKGDMDDYNKYHNRAVEMARIWEQTAKEGDHYRLAFDRPGTWSQKYNIIWDKLWNTHIFSDDVMKTETAFYLKHQNKYGLPLDSRKDYTKSDWIMWTADMARDTRTFTKFVNPLWDYINETTSRVPVSDWHETKLGTMVGFKARSVIGGYWMRVLDDKINGSK